MPAIDLSERIRSINRMNGVKTTPQPEEDMGDWPPLEQVKPLMEDQQEVKPLMEDQQEPTAKDDDVIAKLDLLIADVQAINAEIKKINKHINWTQKLLKKGAK